ncbi:helix-turn-helix domain-containing protein [Trueperella bialowiezensis]|uniref:HTH-type transcriptional regulator immR n=1 Tax=Trueperella bialowiezensis TaxID=312285 RepID=A0A448PDQ1_9ACTO|nr:helix-turn-helix transcriptional regulator [Trueperella bialowiezensis]VEI13066.1 HTH-type transcriptional regulator immR [Trueperella bialowiezensis]
MEISARIKELRTKAGLSQTELAEKLSVSRQAVSKWESGRGTPDIVNIQAMAALFDVSVDYLLGNIEVSPTPKVRVPIDVDSLTPVRPKGKILKRKTHAAVLAAHPRATTIHPLNRTKVKTKAENLFEWVAFLLEGTIFGTFQSIDAFSNRDAYYLVEEKDRQFLARVSREAVESQELLQPVTGNTFTVGQNKFQKQFNPIKE